MKKIILLTLLCYIFNLSLSQAQEPLKVREVYDFAVGDTFQYQVALPLYSVNTNPPPSKYRQVVILSKQLDTVKKRFLYKTQIEEYTPSYEVRPIVYQPIYVKTTDSIVTEHWDSIVKAKNICQNINRPATCFDSLVNAYGNRKTLKHEYFYGLVAGKTHYTTGLGLTLDYAVGDQLYNLTKMIFYSKNGQKWGERSSVFELCKPLSMREVYDFNESDIFIYRNKTYNFNISRRDTLYEKRTVLKKQSFLSDSIIYLIKSEKFYESSSSKIIVDTNNFVVKDLDSLALYKLKARNALIVDKCETLRNSERTVNGRELSGRIDYCESSFVGRGTGEVRSLTCLLSYDMTTDLIYFKKSTEIWGTPIDFTSSIFIPSVFESKITLFPNPAHDILTLKSDEPFDKIHIINSQGVIVASESGFLTNEKAVSLAHLPNGMYFTQAFKGKILRGVNKFVLNN
jgi:hypothetical protein